MVLFPDAAGPSMATTSGSLLIGPRPFRFLLRPGGGFDDDALPPPEERLRGGPPFVLGAGARVGPRLPRARSLEVAAPLPPPLPVRPLDGSARLPVRWSSCGPPAARRRAPGRDVRGRVAMRSRWISLRFSGRLWPGFSLRSSISGPICTRISRRTFKCSSAAMRRIWRFLPSRMMTRIHAPSGCSVSGSGCTDDGLSITFQSEGVVFPSPRSMPRRTRASVSVPGARFNST